MKIDMRILGLILLALGVIGIIESALGLYNGICGVLGWEGISTIMGIGTSDFLYLFRYPVIIVLGYIFINLHKFFKRDVFINAGKALILLSGVNLSIVLLKLLIPELINSPVFKEIVGLIPYLNQLIWIILGILLYTLGETYLRDQFIKNAAFLIIILLTYAIGIILIGLRMSIKSYSFER